MAEIIGTMLHTQNNWNQHNIYTNNWNHAYILSIQIIGTMPYSLYLRISESKSFILNGILYLQLYIIDAFNIFNM